MSAAPSVIRRKLQPFETEYTTLPNRWLRDERLSYKARGILALLMSHVDGYEISIADLAKGSFKEGREAVMTGLKELRGYGYLTMDKSRRPGGTFTTEYVLQDPEPDLLIHRIETESANPTRSVMRSANQTATRSANPTSIEKPIKEITTTSTTYSSDNVSSAFWNELCTAAGDIRPEPHRRRYDGLCADCLDSPEQQFNRAAKASPNRKEGDA